MAGGGGVFEQFTPYLWVVQSRLFATNSGIMVDGTEACLIDPGIYPDEIEAIAHLVTERGALPRSIVLTHGHWDHILGPERFPGVPVIAHSLYAAGMAGERGQGTAQQVERFVQEARVERGGPFSPPGAAEVFDDARMVPVGNTEVRLVHAPGHEVDEIVVYHPETAALWAGDMLSDLEIPFVFDSLLAYERTLDMIAPWEVRVLVPGNGRPTADVAEIRARVEHDRIYVKELHERVAQAVGAGRTREETVALCDSMRYRHPEDNRPAHEANVQVAYEEMRGA